MPHENPYWVNKLHELLKESKIEKQQSEQIKKEQIIITTRDEGLLWTEMLNELYKLDKKEIIPFPMVFEKICTKFSMTKAKAWNCLFFLREFGFIEIAKCHGIRLNYCMNSSAVLE